jgi:hypothetical protein
MNGFPPWGSAVLISLHLCPSAVNSREFAQLADKSDSSQVPATVRIADSSAGVAVVNHFSVGGARDA